MDLYTVNNFHNKIGLVWVMVVRLREKGSDYGKSSNSRAPSIGSSGTLHSDVTEKEKIMFSLDKWDIVSW